MYYIRRRKTQRRLVIAGERLHSYLTPPTAACDWCTDVPLGCGHCPLYQWVFAIVGTKSGSAGWSWTPCHMMLKRGRHNSALPNRPLFDFKRSIYTRKHELSSFCHYQISVFIGIPWYSLICPSARECCNMDDWNGSFPVKSCRQWVIHVN